MNWSEPRKNYKSSETHINQRVSTTCMHTPPKQEKNHRQGLLIQEPKHCPYHFGKPSHVCLTCRRSICLRCAITYCQQHTIHPQQQILPLLVVDLQKLTIDPRAEDIELKLKQSQQRQEYLSKKITKMLAQVQQNFEYITHMLERKKEQIIQYFQEEFAEKYLGEFKRYDQDLYEKLGWLRQVVQDTQNCNSVEQLDNLASFIKRYASSEPAKSQAKVAKIILGKEKVKFHSLWSEEKLEKVLYEIENINYKLKDIQASVNSTKKKRVTTQVSETHPKITPFNASSKNPFAGIMKTNSNSKFPTGRKAE